jgi:heavy metal sensor kinase
MSSETRRKRKSLSRRITATYALLFCSMLLFLSLFVYLSADEYLVSRQRERIETKAEIIADRILEEVRDGETLADAGMLSEFNTDANQALLLKDINGEVVSVSRNFRIDEMSVPTRAGKAVLYTSAEKEMLLCYEEALTDEIGTVGSLIVVINLRDERAFLLLLRWLLLGANLLGALTALVVGWFMTRRMLTPIGDMIQRARTIDSRMLSARLDEPEANDELKALAVTINEMLGRVEDAFVRLGQFTQDASHEFRTPLAILQGNADLLARWGKDDPEVREKCIASIQRQVIYMNRLVENLLFLARGDNGQQIVEAKRVDLPAFLVELLAERRSLDQGHVYRMEGEGEAFLSADSALIRQLMYILIDNAAKYTPDGGTIRIGYTQSDGHTALYVADEGCGIEPEQLPLIFERFYRLDKARARATGGMGLGLSIARMIVLLHGGEISAQSEPGTGARIIASFPA